MAFMGVLLVIIVIVSALGAVFFLGMLPIIVGTILINTSFQVFEKKKCL